MEEHGEKRDTKRERNSIATPYFNPLLEEADFTPLEVVKGHHHPRPLRGRTPPPPPPEPQGGGGGAPGAISVALLKG